MSLTALPLPCGQAHTDRTAGPGVRGVPQADAIRAWAKEQRISVSARGRIPANIVERFEAAMKER
jgi:hypothetical protein